MQKGETEETDACSISIILTGSLVATNLSKDKKYIDWINLYSRKTQFISCSNVICI